MADKKLKDYYGLKLTEEQIQDLEGRSFIVGGKSYNMRNLWLMTVSKDFDNYPEEQAEARTVYNALAEELGQEDNKATQTKLIVDGVKGGFVDYFSKALEVHTKIAKQIQKLDRELEQAESDFKMLSKENGNDMYLQNQYKMALMTAQNKHHDEMEVLKNTVKLEYERLKTGLNEKLVEFYKPNGKAIDSDTVALLNSNIKLSDKEIKELAITYKENPTMIRLISGYCDNNDIRNSYVNGLNKLAISEGKAEMTELNTLMELSERMFTKDGKHWSEPNNYIGVFNGKIQAMANNTLHPEALPTAKAESDGVADNKPDEGNNPPSQFTAPVY